MEGTKKGGGVVVRAVATAALVAALAAALSVAAGPAGAAFPGENGTVVFEGWKRLAGGGSESVVLAVEPDGSGYTRLAQDASGPSVSPDGERIAFARDGDVWVMDADGSGQARVTEGPGDDRDPAWSPDGERIAFSRAREGCGSYCHAVAILSVGADGSGLADLTAGRGFGTAEEPAWSPNGKRIAFSGSRADPGGGTREGIFLMNPDGSRAAELVGSSSEAYAPGYGAPDWSPDGTRIAYNIFPHRQEPQVHVAPSAGPGSPEGGDGVSLVTLRGGGPAWSPDGARIAFWRPCYYWDPCGDNGSYDDDPYQGIYTANPDGSGEARLTTPEQRAADGNLYGPSWGARPGTAAPPAADRPPVASRDAFVGREDAPLRVAAPGVLKNDRDPEGDALSARAVARPRHGTLRLNPGGSFAYRPDEDYHGEDYFSYRASDGAGESGAVTVRIRVGARPG